MELEENDYILGYWFCSNKDDDCWYMMVIKRDGKWIGQCTARINREPDGQCNPFSGVDEKIVRNFKIPENDEKTVIEKSNKIFKDMKILFPLSRDYFLVQGDREKFMKIARTKPYLHIKEVKLND